MHPALCASSMRGIHQAAVADIWANWVHYWQTCKDDKQICPLGLMYLATLDFLYSEEILVGLPTECQASREALTELKEGVTVIRRANSHTIENMTLLGLTSIGQSWRIKNAMDLVRVGYPFCAGYQTSVALQRALVEPVFNSRNRSHSLSNAQKFTIGFLDGVTLAPMVDTQCASSLRFTAPSLVEDLVKPSLRSVYNLLQICSNSVAECIKPEFFRDMEYRPHFQNLLTAMEDPKILQDAWAGHRVEIAANLAAMGLAAKNGDFDRAGEELGKMVGLYVYLTPWFNSAAHV